MPGIQKTEKVTGQHHTYRRTGCGATNASRFGGHYFQLVKHKNAIKTILIADKQDKNFHTTQVISPSEARRLIAWLARYIAYSDPDPISLSIAASKAHADGVIREQANIATTLGLKP